MEPARRTLPPARPGGTEFDRLKTLLFRPEAQQLSTLEATVDALDQRLGTSDRLEKATAEVLVEALRRAEVAQHRELSEAMAPMVVAAIRNEIKNSKDMMVEALYPITGRLVSAGIAVAMAELAASINARMDNLFSAGMLKLRLQAWRTGKSISELAFVQAQRGKLVRLLYLERGSGQLLGQWQADHGEDARADLISGMIAALTDFSRNALGDGGGELRNLDLGGRKIYLRSSAQTIVAAEFVGELDAVRQRALDAAFLDLLDSNAKAGDHAGGGRGLETLAATVEQAALPEISAKKRLSPLHFLGMAVLAGLSIWGYVEFGRWQTESRVAAALAQAVSQHPDLRAYPLSTRLRHKAGVVVLTGLVPSREDEQALIAALGAASAPYKLQPSLALVTPRPKLDEIAAANLALEQRLASLNAETRALQERLASDATATRAQLAERIQGEVSALSARLTQYYVDLNATRTSLSGEAGAGAAALRVEIEQGLARLSADSAAIKAGTEAKMQEEISALTARLESTKASLAQARADAARKSSADAAALDTLRAETAQDLTAARQEVSALAAGQAFGFEQRLADLQAQLLNARAQLADKSDQGFAAAQAELAALKMRLNAPLARLEEELRGLAIYFEGTTDVIEDAAAVRDKLAAVAALAAAAGGIRVVGHSDSSGLPAANLKISRLRAEAVAKVLAELGLDRQRIIIAPRGDGVPLGASGDARAQRSRRVTLEPLFANEIRP